MSNRYEEIQAWIAALRSDEYKQSVGTLKQADNVYGVKTVLSYCCLGVLCEIMEVPYTVRNGAYLYQGNYLSTLPDSIRSRFNHQIPCSELMNMNDIKGKSFHEIADYIEAEVLPKFEHEKDTQNGSVDPAANTTDGD